MTPRIPTARVCRSALAALLATALPAAAARAASSETHVEFDLSSTERVGNVNQVLTDSNLPDGIDGSSSAIDTGSIDGTFGDHQVTVEATVGTQNGLTRLRARGEHHFDLTGNNLTTDQWRQKKRENSIYGPVAEVSLMLILTAFGVMVERVIVFFFSTNNVEF